MVVHFVRILRNLPTFLNLISSSLVSFDFNVLRFSPKIAGKTGRFSIDFVAMRKREASLEQDLIGIDCLVRRPSGAVPAVASF